MTEREESCQGMRQEDLTRRYSLPYVLNPKEVLIMGTFKQGFTIFGGNLQVRRLTSKKVLKTPNTDSQHHSLWDWQLLKHRWWALDRGELGEVHDI